MEFEVVKEVYNIRSVNDRRKRVDKMVISIEKYNKEYRKGFEFPVKTPYKEKIRAINNIIQGAK